MKIFGSFLAALLAAVALTGPSTVSANVAGVDFGGEFFKIALVKPGTPFEIVTNIHSKRKTETMVAFDNGERLYGADAVNIGVRRPHTCYAQVRRFLGTTPEDPAIASLIEDEYFPYELSQNDTRGTVLLKHGDDQHFHAEELVAMVFTHARQITDAFAEAPVKDWVLTVPDFFTQAQRQAMLDAAEISGVRALSLINENTAAALQLGVHSTFSEPRKVLFYNLGSTSLQVSVVEFSSQVVPDGFKKNKTVSGFEVLSKAWDANLGGAKFDLRLAEHLAAEFSDKVGEDVRQIPRPMAKIRAQAKKTKVVLSANEQIPVVMQGLHKDIDFFTSMTRSKFEEICSDLFAKTLAPVQEALDKAGLTAADIHDVEIIGGGVRMPKIQQQLKEFFSGKDLGVHLNGDEAMALGAAFRAANLSNSFRVRHVGMTDQTSYPVGVRLVDLDHPVAATEDKENEKNWVKRASLFVEGSKLGLRKAVSFLHSKDISATFRYDKPSTLPVGASSHIAKLNITGIEEFATKFADKNLGEPKVTLSFELDGSGIVKIAKAEATLEEEYEVEVEVKKESKKKAKKDKKKTDKKDDKDADEDAEEDDEKKEEEPVEKVKQIKKKTHRAVLLVTQAYEKWAHESGISVLPMSVTEKKDSIRMLREMEQADNQRRADLEAKNRLETFIYTARDTLSAQEEDFKAVTTSEQLEKLSAKLEETEEWLYDDGEKVSAAEYNKKINSLDTDFTAILFRISEKKNFPAAINTANEYAFSTKELMQEWVESKPQVTEEERKDVLDKVEELESWLSDAEKKKAAQDIHEKPAVTSAEVEKKVQGVKKLVSTLSKKPQPKPVKTEEETKKEEGEDAKGDAKEGEEKKAEETVEEVVVDDKGDLEDDDEAHEEL